MRRLLFPALGLLFAAAFFAPRGVCLAGNVLLPGNSYSGGSSASQPSLGLSVAPTQQRKKQSMSNEQFDEHFKESVALGLQQSMSSKKSQTPKSHTSSPAPSSSSSSVRVNHETDMSGIIARRDRNLPNSLAISMSNKSSLSAIDMAEISNKLGLTSSQIDASCILSANGRLQTNRGERDIYGGPFSQIVIRYEGAITGLQLTARALCLVKGDLPQQSGTLTQLGNRYVIPLQPISCPAPNGEAANLTITYAAGKTQCMYQ